MSSKIRTNLGFVYLPSRVSQTMQHVMVYGCRNQHMQKVVQQFTKTGRKVEHLHIAIRLLHIERNWMYRQLFHFCSCFCNPSQHTWNPNQNMDKMLKELSHQLVVMLQISIKLNYIGKFFFFPEKINKKLTTNTQIKRIRLYSLTSIQKCICLEWFVVWNLPEDCTAASTCAAAVWDASLAISGFWVTVSVAATATSVDATAVVSSPEVEGEVAVIAAACE